MAEKAGFLYVNQGKSWKRAWFVFRPAERLLLQYKKDEEAFLGKTPAGFVDMTAYILSREPKDEHQHCIRLVDQNYKPVYLSSNDPNTLDDWIRALTTVGKQVYPAREDLDRKEAARQREEDLKAKIEKEKDESEIDKQDASHKKQRRLLTQKHVREEFNLNRRSSKDAMEQRLKHEDALLVLGLDQKEEKEDLVEKIREKYNPTPKDLFTHQRKQKLLDRQQEREKLSLQRKHKKKEEETNWKHDDDLNKLQIEQKEEDEDLAAKQELERKALADKHEETHDKLDQKCFLEMEKLLDEIQARREKLMLAKAAAEVIAKEGPTKSIKDLPKLSAHDLSHSQHSVVDTHTPSGSTISATHEPSTEIHDAPPPPPTATESHDEPPSAAAEAHDEPPPAAAESHDEPPPLPTRDDAEEEDSEES